jgi:hypothetical protein
MRQSLPFHLRFRLPGAPARADAAPLRLVAHPSDELPRQAEPGFLAQLHPLHRQFLAYAVGQQDGQPHSLAETAEHFGIDLATARLTAEYLRARYDMHVTRTGWRASQIPTW